MANGNARRYYWLRLHRDFFKRHDTRIIEDRENGREYLLFYLKLMTESLDHDGCLRFSESVPYDETMLSTITHTPIEIVRDACALLTELKLLECLQDDTLSVVKVEEMVGSETFAAKRKRKERVPCDNVTDEGDNVTDTVEIVAQSIESRDQRVELDQREERAREDNFLSASEAHTTEVDTFEPPETDPVLDTYREGIEALGLPTTAWTNPGAQHVALKDIAERTKILAAQSPIPDPCDFARGILAVFKRRKETGKGDYWKNASPAPKVLKMRFDELVIGLSDEHQQAEVDRKGLNALRRMGKNV